MLIFSRAANRLRSLISNGQTAARFLSYLGHQGIEQRNDLKPFLAKSRIVGERQTEIAGAEDGNLQLQLEPENLAEMALQILDVVAHPSDAERAEIGQILPDLGRIQVKLLGEHLRRHRLHSGRVQRVEAAEVHRQPVGRELRDLIAELFALDR